jgi:hypothetical protein
VGNYGSLILLEEEDGHRRIRWLFGRKKAVLPSVIVGGPNWCGVRQLSRNTSVLGVGPKSFSLGVWAGPPDRIQIVRRIRRIV